MTGTVETDLERVVAWWFHADRSEEQREEFGLFAAGEVSLERSVVDGVRIRDFRWKSRQGRHLHHHIETTLTDDGTSTRGRSYCRAAERCIHLRVALRAKYDKACNGRIEFIAQVDGTTEIRFTHQHTLVGGNRIEQWFPPPIRASDRRSVVSKDGRPVPGGTGLTQSRRAFRIRSHPGPLSRISSSCPELRVGAHGPFVREDVGSQPQHPRCPNCTT